MRKSLKRSLSCFLAASLVCTMLPAGSESASAAGISSGRSVVKLSSEGKTAEATGTPEASEATPIPDNGTFGGEKDSLTGQVTTEDTHKWSFDEATGVLTISVLPGQKGDMPDYTSSTYVQAPWYPHNEKIKKVVFQKGVTSIGDYTFYKDYPALTEADASAEGIAEIGSNAFASSGLEKIAGLEKVETIKASAFANSALNGDLTLTAATEIGTSAFSGTEITSVTAPALLDASTANYVFSKCAKILSVTMENVTAIGSNFFENCTAMTSVSMGALETAGANAFSGCKALKTISLPALTEIPNRMFEGTSIDNPNLPLATSVGEYVFDGSQALTTVNLPKVTTLGSGAFRNCINLTEAIFPGVEQVRGSNVFENCHALVYCSFGDKLTTLNGVFKGKVFQSFQRLYLNGEVSYAVGDFLPSLDIKVYVKNEAEKTKWTDAGVNNVEAVEDFGTLKKENRLRISQSDYDLSDPKDPEVVENTAASDGGAVTYKYYKRTSSTSNKFELVDSDHPTKRPEEPGEYYVQAFTEESANYFGTSSNFVPFTAYGETKGKGWSYHNKTNTFTITDSSLLEQSYTSASERPYNQFASKIENIALGEGVTLNKVTPYLFTNMSEVKEFPVEDTLESVGTAAFESCRSWEREKPLTIKDVGENSFNQCSKLSATLIVAEGVETIPTQAFAAAGMKEIKLPESLRTIESMAFSSCSGLKTISIPDGVTTIGADCFWNSSSLESIKLPEGLTDLGSTAFNGCAKLETIELPPNLTTLKPSTFKKATGLKTICIPETVTKIEGIATDDSGLFEGCKKLEMVVFDRTDYTEETFAKSGKPATYTVDGKADTYTVDQTFHNVSANVQVVCDGATFTLLQSYADQYNYKKNKGWVSNTILHKPDEYKTEYEEVRNAAAALNEADFDKDLFAALQTVIKEADELVGEQTTPYKKLLNQRKGKEDILAAVRAFVVKSYAQTLSIVESDYINDDSSEEVLDQWYAYLDLRDDTESLLNDGTGATVDIYAAADKDLRAAMALLTPLPTEEAAAAMEEVLAGAKALNQADYTEESWQFLQDAITAAEEVKANGKCISEFEAAQKKIEVAVEALEKIPGADATEEPSEQPEIVPTDVPSEQPEIVPTDVPSDAPSEQPGAQQTAEPTDNPGTEQTEAPTDNPGTQQTVAPTDNPGTQQTVAPTDDPGAQQTTAPSGQTTKKPASDASKKKVTVKKVTIKKVSSKKKKTIVVQWKKLSGVTGYQIVIGLDKKMKKGKKTVTVKKANTVKATIRKLKSKKKYFVKVRAYKTVKGKKYYGSYSKVKAAKVK